MDESAVSTLEFENHAEHVYVSALRYVQAFEQATERGFGNVGRGDPLGDAYARLREAVIEGDEPRVEVSGYDEPL